MDHRKIGPDVRYLKFLERLNHEMGEVFDRWDDIAARKNLGWAEGYANGRFGVGATLKYRIGGDEEFTILAWFENCPIANTYISSIKRVETWVGYDRQGHHNGNCAVFVGSVNLVQGPKGEIPSLRALYFVKKETAELFEANLYEVAPHGCLEVGPRISEGPIGLVLAKIMASVDRTDSGVQCTSQIADYVADGEADRHQGVCLHENFTNILPRISLFDSYPHAIFDVPCELRVQILRTIRGPMGF